PSQPQQRRTTVMATDIRLTAMATDIPLIANDIRDIRLTAMPTPVTAIPIQLTDITGPTVPTPIPTAPIGVTAITGTDLSGLAEPRPPCGRQRLQRGWRPSIDERPGMRCAIGTPTTTMIVTAFRRLS